MGFGLKDFENSVCSAPGGGAPLLINLSEVDCNEVKVKLLKERETVIHTIDLQRGLTQVLPGDLPSFIACKSLAYAYILVQGKQLTN